MQQIHIGEPQETSLIEEMGELSFEGGSNSDR